MLKNPDISWFDLRKYDKLNEIDLFDWYEQIKIRTYLLEYANRLNTYIDEHEQAYIDGLLNLIKINPIFVTLRPNDSHKYFFGTYPRGYVSVDDTRAYEFYYVIDDDRFNNIWNSCREMGCFDVAEEHVSIANTPMSEVYDSIGTFYDGIKYITVDLRSSDEQVIGDFKKWLSKKREVADLKPTKNNFTELNINCWVKDRLLPYIDLFIINEFENLGLTQVAIANLVHSDDVNVDAVDRTRRTTKPKAIKLFTNNVVQQLKIQLECMELKN